MRKLLVATHERFASGIMETFKLIMGENENISALSAYVEPGFDMHKEAEKKIHELDEGDELIIVADIMGGSIANTFSSYIQSEKIHIITGLNLPLLIGLAQDLDSDVSTDELIENAIQMGNILGAVIYFLLYTAIHFITKILGGKYGYKMGTKFLENSEENHLMDKLSMGASILGMTVIGAMIGTMVSLQTTLSFTLAGTETTLQSIFDQIFPGILPLGATFLCVALFNKNVKTIYIIIGIFVLCILGCAIGIF